MNYDFSDVRVDTEGVYTVFTKDGKESRVLSQEYSIDEWDSVEAYSHVGIKGYEPMTAKELDTPEKQEEAFSNPDNFIEEKFDGTRGIVQFFNCADVDGNRQGYARVFSRRISKKTGFYVENSDSVPQIKFTDNSDLAGTIIDGEMFINGRPFKDVSSTMNCLWDKAIERQIEKGFISLHAFDVIKYKGIDLRRVKLEKRKEFLRKVIEQADNKYIEEVEYYRCGDVLRYATTNVGKPVSYSAMIKRRNVDDSTINMDSYPALKEAKRTEVMTPRAYYELIVATGGEGVIIKPREGKYKHKRGWEYSKIKKFLTREMIVMGFSEPTREYEGKAPQDWAYWEGDTPVTKHYYNRQVGNLLLGVIIPKEEYEKISKDKRGEVEKPSLVLGGGWGYDDHYYIMQVCECGGFDDATRDYFTRNRKKVVGRVVEVKANEIMRDSGRLRHPRYERMRDDKGADRCIWEDHIS